MNATITQANFNEFINSEETELWNPTMTIVFEKGDYGLGITKFTGKYREKANKTAVNDFRRKDLKNLFKEVKEELKNL